MRAVRQPHCHSQQDAEQRSYDTDDETVGPYDQADVVIGGAKRSEHADGAEPALRQHGEAPYRNQRDEQHPQRGKGQHDGLGVQPVTRCCAPYGLKVGTEGDHVDTVRVEQHRRLGRLRHLPGRHQGKFVEQALGVLHYPDDSSELSRLVPDVTDLEVQGGRNATRQGHLARTDGVLPAHQREHGLTEGSPGVLGAQIVGTDGAGDAERLVLDDIDLMEALLHLCNIATQLRR